MADPTPDPDRPVHVEVRRRSPAEGPTEPTRPQTPPRLRLSLKGPLGLLAGLVTIGLVVGLILLIVLPIALLLVPLALAAWLVGGGLRRR